MPAVAYSSCTHKQGEKKIVLEAFPVFRSSIRPEAPQSKDQNIVALCLRKNGQLQNSKAKHKANSKAWAELSKARPGQAGQKAKQSERKPPKSKSSKTRPTETKKTPKIMKSPKTKTAREQGRHTAKASRQHHPPHTHPPHLSPSKRAVRQ